MALFKIYNNIDSNNELPTEHHKGYMYFDISTKIFYIDVKDDEYDNQGNLIPEDPNDQSTWYRFPLNAWGANKTYADEQGDRILTTYVKYSDYSKLTMHGKLSHKLTFGAGGAYVFDGSEDVTVPVYTGTYSVS